MSTQQLLIFDSELGGTRPATTDDFGAGPALTPLGNAVSITVGTSSATLAALMAAASSSIGATCTWIELRIRDDQTAANVVKINYTAAASATSYDALMTRDPARFEPDALVGHSTKVLFDAYALIATANTAVLVRQYAG